MNYQFQAKKSRACVFIDSSNPELPNQVMNHSSHPFIKPPFPPHIDPKDLLIISKDNKPSRSPNAFIIYRKVFLKTTRDQGYSLPMTIVSSMASKSWDQESNEVRSYYKKLAKDAYKYRTEKFPKKVRRRRKKEPWNSNVAFQNDLHNTFFDNHSNHSNSTENPSTPEYQLTKDMVPSPDMISLNYDYDLPSRNSSPNLEHQVNDPSLFNENNNFQGLLFSSPNLSDNSGSSIVSSPNMNNEFTVVDDNLLLNNNNNNINSNSNSSDSNILYQNLTNFLLFNPNNFSLNNEMNNFTPNGSNSCCCYNNTENSTVEPLTIYPTTDFLNYQDVLGINPSPIGSGYENTFYSY